MAYLEYNSLTGDVVQIHEIEPMESEVYKFCISDQFVVGDEFEQSIKISNVDANKFLISYSAIRNNPNAKRLLRENNELKALNEDLTNYILDVDMRLVMIELDI